MKQLQAQLMLNKAFLTDIEIYNQYVGRKVVIEDSLGMGFSTANLARNGAYLIELEDYKEYETNIKGIDMIRKGMIKKTSPIATLPKKVIQKSAIASIQALEDVLGKSKYEDIFEKC